MNLSKITFALCFSFILSLTFSMPITHATDLESRIHEVVAEQKNQTAIIVDVREADEVKGGMI